MNTFKSNQDIVPTYVRKSHKNWICCIQVISLQHTDVALYLIKDEFYK